MAKSGINRQIINGRMVVTRNRRHLDGYCAESVMYPGPAAKGEPLAVHRMSRAYRHDLGAAARIAEERTTREPS